MTVLLFGSEYSPRQNRHGFNTVYNTVEKVQMTCFYLQELTISGLYIWKTLDILKTAFGSSRRILWKLFVINISIVMMDVGLLTLEYMDFYLWDQGVKVVTYSIKLKLEFAVLGELIDFIKNRGGTTQSQSYSQSHSGKEYRSTKNSVPLSSLHKGTSKSTATMTEPVFRGDTQSSTTVAATRTATNDTADDIIRVVTEVDVESLSADQRDDRSTDALYDHIYTGPTEPGQYPVYKPAPRRW
ncbi:hypothetical protein ACHAPJ_007474 [Fusarium lateritium]